MTQRWIEIVIGKLVTDERLRRRFLNDPRATVVDLLERGTHLTPAEIAALIAIDATLWDFVAAQVNPRLRKLGSNNE